MRKQMGMNEWFGNDGSLYTQFCETNVLLKAGLLIDTHNYSHAANSSLTSS